MTDGEVLVFDTGPLSHFARANWLGALKFVVGERVALVPDAVVAELVRGATQDSRLGAALDAQWIQRRVLSSDDETLAFARFASLLVSGNRNFGEAAVLALASTVNNGVAVIDDGVARKAATDNGIPLRPTLALLCEAIRAKQLTVTMVSALADDLLRSQYRLPFDTGGFERWAIDNGQFT